MALAEREGQLKDIHEVTRDDVLHVTSTSLRARTEHFSALSSSPAQAESRLKTRLSRRHESFRRGLLQVASVTPWVTQGVMTSLSAAVARGAAMAEDVDGGALVVTGTTPGIEFGIDAFS